MAVKDIYLDNRIIVSGKKSHIYLDNPFDLNKHIKSLISAVPSPGGSYTFENGLTETAGTVKLGGLLNDYADIDGDLGTQAVRFMNMQVFSAETDNPASDHTYHLYLNNSVPTGYALNGFSNMGLVANRKLSTYGAGYFLTENGADPRPYIVSEMEYGRGTARTAKIEFSNDYILNSHKFYDVVNPTSYSKEYSVQLGDNEVLIQSTQVNKLLPADITENIVNSIVVDSNGVSIGSSSTTGTPTFIYTFPVTSSTKPMPTSGHSMVLNSTGTQFDFVKDYKCLGQSLFAVGETVTNKTILLAAPFNNYILESVSIIAPTGSGSFDLTIQKLLEIETFNISAAGSLFKVNTPTIATPITNNEVISIDVSNVSAAMTQLSVTLNFLYAG